MNLRLWQSVSIRKISNCFNRLICHVQLTACLKRVVTKLLRKFKTQFEFRDLAKLILILLKALQHREVSQYRGFRRHCKLWMF